MHPRRFLLLVLGLGLATTSSLGCSGASDSSPGPPPSPPPTVFTDFGGRTVELHVPGSYAPDVLTPLVILLHGYSATGMVQELYWRLKPEADRRGVLYAHPDGTVDLQGARFWNATEACCDFSNSGVDDSAYLRALVEQIREHYAVDPKRIYFTGHSNGAFMSYRMACDHADWVAAIAGLAGGMLADAENCKASEPVHVLHIHGDQDALVEYEGSTTGGIEAPGARASAQFWADRAGCEPDPVTESPLELAPGVDGAETLVERWQGCGVGGSAELWTMRGVGHVPGFDDTYPPALFDYLLSHPKP